MSFDPIARLDASKALLLAQSSVDEVSAAKSDIVASTETAVQHAGIATDAAAVATEQAGLASAAADSVIRQAATVNDKTNITIDASAAAVEHASIASDAAETAITKANIAMDAADTAAAQASVAVDKAATISGLLNSFRQTFLGAFASDGDATAFAAANGITLAEGLMYENTASDKFRIYVEGAWADYDASAQVSQAAAGLAAANAANSETQAAQQASVAADHAANAQTTLDATQAVAASLPFPYRTTRAIAQADNSLANGVMYVSDETGTMRMWLKTSSSASTDKGAMPTTTYTDRLKPKVLVPTVDLGAVGSGASAVADQVGIGAAFTAMLASRSNVPIGSFGPLEYQNGIVLEPGIYDAGDFAMGDGSLRIAARIPWSVIIRIPDDKYFCQQTGTPYTTVIDGIIFIGGKGAYKNSRTSGNVQNLTQFTRCLFYNYTECAISNNTSDGPYVKVKDCFFAGKTGYSTIAVALGGLLDQVMICDNSFGPNTYHVVLGNRVGGNVSILRNDFIGQLGAIETKADIWFVPGASNVSLGTVGYGVNVDYNKFGNEGQVAGNPRILVAPTDGVTGTDRATYRHGTTDTGMLAGVNFRGNKIVSISGPNAPFIKSYISGLVNWSGRDNQFTGGTYTHVIDFPNGKTSNFLSTASDWEFTQAAGGVPDRFCDYPIGTLRDHAGYWPGDINRVSVHPLVDDPTASPVVSLPSANLFGFLSGSSAVSVTDPYGLSEYAAITGGISAGFTDPYAGAGGPMVLEVALAQAASRSLTHVVVDVFNYASSAVGFQRRVLLPSPSNPTKATYHILLPPHASPGTWQVRVYGYNVVSGTSDTFVSGELYLYKGRGKLGRDKMLARWPQAPRNRSLIGGAAGALPTGWSFGTNAGGLTSTVNRVGEDQYGTFAEIAISGTTTNANGWTLFLEAAKALGFTASSQWLYQIGARVVGGDFTGVSSTTGYDGSTGQVVMQAPCYNAAGAWLLQRGIAFTPDATFRLFGRTFSANYFSGSTDYVIPAIGMAISNATTVNVTLRIYIQPIIRVQ